MPSDDNENKTAIGRIKPKKVKAIIDKDGNTVIIGDAEEKTEPLKKTPDFDLGDISMPSLDEKA